MTPFGFCHDSINSFCISIGSSLKTLGSTLRGNSDSPVVADDDVEHDATGRKSSSLRFEKQRGETIFLEMRETGVDVWG